MKTASFDAFGGPDLLALRELPDVVVAPGEVLVRTEYCGVNRLDLMLRQGKLGKTSFPKVIGSEVAGVVLSAPASSPHLRVGLRVAIAPWLCCGTCRFCLTGNDSVCLNSSILGVSRSGGYGSLVAVPPSNCVEIPDGLSTDAAAALTLSGLTAYHMLRRAALRAGERIWIRAGASGVSSIAVRLASAMGAVVVTDTTQSSKRAFLESLGASEVLVLDSEGALAKALGALELSCDVVFDHVGSATWKVSAAALAPNGRYVTCGATTGGEVTLDLVELYYRQHSVIGSRGGSRAELRELLNLAVTKRIDPVIDSVLPIEDAAAAHTKLERGEQNGKILLRFSS